MAGFGSPAVAVQEEVLIGAVPSSASFRTFLQAVASQAHGGHDDSHAFIRSPWAQMMHHNQPVSNAFLQSQNTESLGAQPGASVNVTIPYVPPRDPPQPQSISHSDNGGIRHESCRTVRQETNCSLQHRGSPFGIGASHDAMIVANSVPDQTRQVNRNGMLPHFSHMSTGGISGQASDSEMEESMGDGACVGHESDEDDENCMKPRHHGCNMQFEMLAGDLDHRFEALSMLSPDNQIPLLSRSLGRRVSVHGHAADVLEPWGRAAVFGCNTTSSGKLSIAANLAGVYKNLSSIGPYMPPQQCD